MSNNVSINTNGIKKVLKNYKYTSALVEYFWNGFDAKANTIEFNYKSDVLGNITYMEIIDNGTGMARELIDDKFSPFLDSEKAIQITSPKHTSVMHGKNGIGRLTFFTFAHNVKWITTYSNENKLVSNSIEINVENLRNYEVNTVLPVRENIGTTVFFSNIIIDKKDIEEFFIPFLKREFCWFLELNKSYSIKINGVKLDYSDLKHKSSCSIKIVTPDSNYEFEIDFIQWNEALNKEYSKIYFLNSKTHEVYKDFTSLNKKADNFYHSVYIKSAFFDNYTFSPSKDHDQISIFNEAKSNKDYKYVIEEVTKFLRIKRKDFIKNVASRYIEGFEKNGILPDYKNEWEYKYKRIELIETLKGFYEVQPTLFTSLNIDQKKTFVRLIDALLDSNERESLFKIIEEVVELNSEERKDLANLFQSTSLSKITETIKLLEDRFRTVSALKNLVFNKELKANEVNHLQKYIESHYWLFGEQFHLITAAEPKFEEALRRYNYLLYDKDEVRYINHEHKNKEMDIFACRQNVLNDKIENIVIELKHPNINLGMKEFTQLNNYLDVITKQPDFNASNMHWEFYLVGNKLDNSNAIRHMINSNKSHGLNSLVLNIDDGRIKVFVKTWSEIFTEFEIKHKYLNDKLIFERDKLINTQENANQIVEHYSNNSTVQPKELVLKKVSN